MLYGFAFGERTKYAMDSMVHCAEGEIDDESNVVVGD